MNFIIKIYFVENSIKYVLIPDNVLKSMPLQKDLFQYDGS